ncbi:hypothetical protein FACS1894211_01960 [Clostridia bacterium]|nr:hypothetical protein FACS1894211_01960 [Clostridia bacterium]
MKAKISMKKKIAMIATLLFCVAFTLPLAACSGDGLRIDVPKDVQDAVTGIYKIPKFEVVNSAGEVLEANPVAIKSVKGPDGKSVAIISEGREIDADSPGVYQFTYTADTGSGARVKDAVLKVDFKRAAPTVDIARNSVLPRYYAKGEWYFLPQFNYRGDVPSKRKLELFHQSGDGGERTSIPVSGGGFTAPYGSGYYTYKVHAEDEFGTAGDYEFKVFAKGPFGVENPFVDNDITGTELLASFDKSQYIDNVIPETRWYLSHGATRGIIDGYTDGAGTAKSGVLSIVNSASGHTGYENFTRIYFGQKVLRSEVWSISVTLCVASQSNPDFIVNPVVIEGNYTAPIGGSWNTAPNIARQSANVPVNRWTTITVSNKAVLDQMTDDDGYIRSLVVRFHDQIQNETCPTACYVSDISYRQVKNMWTFDDPSDLSYFSDSLNRGLIFSIANVGGQSMLKIDSSNLTIHPIGKYFGSILLSLYAYNGDTVSFDVMAEAEKEPPKMNVIMNAANSYYISVENITSVKKAVSYTLDRDIDMLRFEIETAVKPEWIIYLDNIKITST